MTYFEDTPFVVDDTRTSIDDKTGLEVRYATAESVQKAFADPVIDRADMATQRLRVPMGAEVIEGSYADVATRYCQIDHLGRNWPAGFMKYLRMLEIAQKHLEA
jgi:hypothetical protein